MIELKKIYILIAKNFYNFSINLIIKISFILYNVYMISANKSKFVFYFNNYINWG